MVLSFKQKGALLKLGVPTKLAKPLKTICVKLRFYCICRLWGSNFIKKKPFPVVSPKGFAKLAYPLHYAETFTAQKLKFFIKDFFSKRNCGFSHIYSRNP